MCGGRCPDTTNSDVFSDPQACRLEAWWHRGLSASDLAELSSGVDWKCRTWNWRTKWQGRNMTGNWRTSCRKRLHNVVSGWLRNHNVLGVISRGNLHDCEELSLCPLSFWLTLSRGVLSTSWCCPSRPCVVFLACMHLARSLHCLFLQSTPLFPHGVTIVC